MTEGENVLKTCHPAIMGKCVLCDCKKYSVTSSPFVQAKLSPFLTKKRKRKVFIFSEFYIIQKWCLFWTRYHYISYLILFFQLKAPSKGCDIMPHLRFEPDVSDTKVKAIDLTVLSPDVYTIGTEYNLWWVSRVILYHLHVIKKVDSPVGRTNAVSQLQKLE